MSTSFAFARPLAATAAFGTFLGVMSVTPEAQALSCDTAVHETLDLELSAVEIGGDEVALDDAAAADLRWPAHVYGADGSVYVGTSDDDDSFRGESFSLDMTLEPTPAVADYLATSAERTSKGFFCSGLPYAAVAPGVYLVETFAEDEGWPEGATLTIDAAREHVSVEFVGEQGMVRAQYEIVDFHFPGDEDGGCSVTGSGSGSATPLGLAVLALIAWRRKSKRA